MPKAVVLLSGGLDSTTCVAIAKSRGFDVYALSVLYGQKQAAELSAAKAIAQSFDVAKHHIIELDLTPITATALVNQEIAVPDFQESTQIPVTYVPARNTLLLSIAMGWAESLEATDIFIGVNQVDYSHYPDCREVFIEQFQKLANIATKSGVEGHRWQLHAPLLHWNKAQIITQGVALGVDYSKTVSCYQADDRGRACGRCDACTFRARGFLKAGIADPTLYVAA